MLKFSDATYGTFFAEELNVNTDEEKYYAEGGSKGKRLRYFPRTESNALAIKALKALWDQRGLSAADHTKTMQAAAKRPLNRHEPRPTPVVPDCPPELGPAAQREWHHATVINSGTYL